MDMSGPHRVVVSDYPATSAEIHISVRGLVVAVGLKVNLFDVYSTSVDVSIVEESDTQPDLEILDVTGITEDGWYFPVPQINGSDGVAIADQYAIGMPVYGNVTIAIANAAPGDEVFITFRMA